MMIDHTMAPIVMADDDEEDLMMTEDALRENRVANPFIALYDGEALLDYLYRRGKFAGIKAHPLPCFVLLDLNMPKMDGREALKIIKSDPNLKKIPVIVLTTSRADEDIARSYNTGANSYIAKPVTLDRLVEAMGTLKDYWLEIVELPED